MRKAKVSLLGLYAYDKTIFDMLALPPKLDRDTFIQMCLFRSADLEVAYPNPAFLKNMIGVWSTAKLESWTRLVDAYAAEYNPIHNFDRYEEYTDNRNVSGTASSSATADAQNTNDNTYSVNAYNEGITDSSKSVDAQTGKALSTSDNSSTTKDDLAHSGHLYGNIGVTTSQQMLTAEVELRKTSVYDILVEEFFSQFILGVY